MRARDQRGAEPRPAASGRLVSQVERFGDRLVADLAARNVEPVGEMRILPHRFLGAEIGDLQRERQSRIVEREGVVRATAPGMLATQ